MVELPGPTQIAVHQVDLTSIIESFQDAIIGMNAAGVINSCNQAAIELYGYPSRDLIGCDATVLIPPEHRTEEAAILSRVMAGEQVEGHSTRRSRRDGTPLEVSMTIAPVRDNTGAVIGAISIAHRTGAPRQAPDAGQSAVTHVEGLGSRTQDDWDQRFQANIEAEYANERVQVHEAQDRFQIRMGEERARERLQVQAAQDRFQVAMGDERAKERVQVYEAQDLFQARMGEQRAEEQVQVQAAQDRFQLAMDAGRARAHQDWSTLQAQSHQTQRLEVLGQLAGGVAHDFNNLLAVILNYAELIAEELAAPEPDLQAASRDVGQIQRAAERAADLTHQLLAFARREVIQPRVLDLNHTVTDVEQLLRRTIGADVLLRTDLAADLWPVLADPGQIEQVLVNLAVNARDAMSAGGTLSIDTANVIIDAPAEGNAAELVGPHVRLQVSDTGTGMSADVVEHAFEPFFTTKSEGAGTGLGLSTVYGIVAQAGGSITIQSQPGTGTTFTVLVPVTDEVALPIEEAAGYQHTPAGETVLIVEDQDALREVTKRIFTRGGYHVIAAADGTEAIRLAAEHDGDIHLLLTDVVMPTMLGKEVADKIRMVKPNIEVIFMSGYAQPVLASEGKLDPDVVLIEKPFTASGILEKAGRALNKQDQGIPHPNSPTSARTESGNTDSDT
jgi:PAS domain S-box-containing protein